MKIELHLLQNFPPANLNRDDMNEPKDCQFGGYRRGRVSSQCIKRSIRNSPYFKETLGDRIGTRTKRVSHMITDTLVAEFGRTTEDADVVARAFADGLVGEGKGGETGVLFYTGGHELKEMAGALNDRWTDLLPSITVVRMAAETPLPPDHSVESAPPEGKKKSERKKSDKDADSSPKDGGVATARKEIADIVANVVTAFKKGRKRTTDVVDIALFGRMLANDPSFNIDAACQVAHAISTNEVRMEFDYYTAVDDLRSDEEPGAGMIGFTGYNSSCFYRYAVIDLDKLTENLGGKRGLAIDGVHAFLIAAATSIPTGKQNTFAAHTPTVMALAVVRESGMSISLANAFESPAVPDRARGRSLVQESISKIDAHWKAITRMYPSKGARPFVVLLDGMGEIPNIEGSATRVTSLTELASGVIEALQSQTREVAAV